MRTLRTAILVVVWEPTRQGGRRPRASLECPSLAVYTGTSGSAQIAYSPVARRRQHRLVQRNHDLDRSGG